MSCALAARPEHEALPGLITGLSHHGFAAGCAELTHEAYLLDGSGRIDTVWDGALGEAQETEALVDALLPV